jgi:hypothetical protein
MTGPMETLGLLTEGRTLPEKRMHARHLRAIAELIVKAWEEVLREIDMTRGEEHITSCLALRLKNMLGPAGPRLPARNLIAGLADDAKAVDATGAELNKRPDLHFVLTDRSFELRGECKLLHRSNGKTISLYCKEGISRFVKGQYAWERQEAFMLAYVLDGSFIHDTLTPHLTKKQREPDDTYSTLHLPAPVPGWNGPQSPAESEHARAFPYPTHPTASPGPIRIWHVWLYPAAETAL